jgi:hypothetical protein
MASYTQIFRPCRRHLSRHQVGTGVLFLVGGHMAGQTTTCASCGSVNAIDQLWCHGCHVPLPQDLSEEGKESTEPVRRVPAASFADEGEHEQPSPTQQLIEAASQWSAVIKPFLLDNVGWFVGAFLIVSGFVVLIATFWGSIERNPILMHSLVHAALLAATGSFFAAAYFMRLRYPQLESSSNVLLVIVALLIPLVFAAAMLTSLVPVAAPDVTFVYKIE